jgi:chemotaxis-related protein WspD
METQSCWKTIGVDGGSSSCDQLPELIHCRNCAVYAQGGRSLFDRPLPADYRQMLTAMVGDRTGATSLKSSDRQLLSLSLFRLQDEWFGLEAGIFHSVAAVVPIRRMPGRSNSHFLGMVNFSGELQLCISLRQFLGIDENQAKQAAMTKTAALISPRMVMVQPDRENVEQRWVFGVDEFYGIERINPLAIQEPPMSTVKSKHPLTQGLFDWQGRSVSYLDKEQLFSTIGRRLLP